MFDVVMDRIFVGVEQETAKLFTAEWCSFFLLSYFPVPVFPHSQCTWRFPCPLFCTLCRVSGAVVDTWMESLQHSLKTAQMHLSPLFFKRLVR